MYARARAAASAAAAPVTVVCTLGSQTHEWTRHSIYERACNIRRPLCCYSTVLLSPPSSLTRHRSPARWDRHHFRSLSLFLILRISHLLWSGTLSPARYVSWNCFRTTFDCCVWFVLLGHQQIVLWCDVSPFWGIFSFLLWHASKENVPFVYYRRERETFTNLNPLLLKDKSSMCCVLTGMAKREN